MIALEVRRLPQANDAQGGGHCALGGGEERPDASGKEWCEGAEQQYHRGQQGMLWYLDLGKWLE